MSDEDMAGCPDCGVQLEADWADVSTLAELPGTSMVLTRLSCPNSHLHDLTAAYEAMRSVRLVHPDHGHRSCPMHRLGHWRQQGWRPVDPDLMTPTELVEQRVDDLGKGKRP